MQIYNSSRKFITYIEADETVNGFIGMELTTHENITNMTLIYDFLQRHGLEYSKKTYWYTHNAA